ncbi:hypothetical protein GN956_G16539 [Arapaima gigas]
MLCDMWSHPLVATEPWVMLKCHLAFFKPSSQCPRAGHRHGYGLLPMGDESRSRHRKPGRCHMWAVIPIRSVLASQGRWVAQGTLVGVMRIRD